MISILQMSIVIAITITPIGILTKYPNITQYKCNYKVNNICMIEINSKINKSILIANIDNYQNKMFSN